MHTKPSFFFRRYSIQFLMVLSILFLSYSTAVSEQVVISPDRVNAPTFKTSTAICYGPSANTHINLGFGTSETGKDGQVFSYCTVGGGYNNTASGLCSTIGGGAYNTASGSYSTVGGGNSNTASGSYSAIGGGWNNTASGFYSTVGSGTHNTASGLYSTIGGGYNNTASGFYSTVGGGGSNKAEGDYSWAGGKFMQLTNLAHHTFVWGYSEADPQPIPTADAFLIFPAGSSGKVGIGTANPATTLHVNDDSNANTAHFVNTQSGTFNQTVLKAARTGLSGGNLFAAVAGSNADGSGGTARMVVSTAGNVGIGVSNPDYTLEVEGNAAKSLGGTTWINSSDERLKDITGEYEQGLDAILGLRPVRFFYKEGNPRGLPTDEENIGFVAQEVQDVFPEAIREGKDGYLDFNMHPVNVAVVNAIKELKAENEAIRAENDSLKAVNASLKKDIERIKAILGI